MAQRAKQPLAGQSNGADQDAAPRAQEDCSGAATTARISAILIAQLTRLSQLGHSLIPLGGDDGKRPLVKLQRVDKTAVHRLPLDLVLDRMSRGRSRTYGIRLDGMLVVDLDTDTPEARKFVEEYIGTSPVKTKTSRGLHLYFRHVGRKPPNVRMPGIAIDFKAGPSEYVVGPCSIRPDGHEYFSDGQLGDKRELPEFRLIKSLPQRSVDRGSLVSGGASGPAVPNGGRHTELFRLALQWVRTSDSYEELLGNLEAHRRIYFDDLESFPDSEVVGIAEATWGYRVRNTLWHGRNSEVSFSRIVMDRLLARRHGVDAFALYCLLKADHGHQLGKRFPIVPGAMRGRIDLCRNHIYRARDILVEEGLLIDHGQAGLNRAKLYQMGGPHIAQGPREDLFLT